MNNKHGFTIEMVVEFITSLLMIVFFFIPWLDGISAANIFPILQNVSSVDSDIAKLIGQSVSGGPGALAYLFLLLYLIPLLAVGVVICFAIQNRKATRSFFLGLCITSVVDMAIVLIFGCGKYDWLCVGFWLSLVFAVGGIICALVMRSKDSEQAQYFAPMGNPDPLRQAPRRFALSVVSGEYIGANIPVPAEGLLIGRDPAEVNLVLTGSDISRKHCLIGYNENRTGLFIVDYSSNGTFLDRSTKLLKNMQYNLNAGQKLYLGNKKQIFEVREV